jgi:hypothetical protein
VPGSVPAWSLAEDRGIHQASVRLFVLYLFVRWFMFGVCLPLRVMLRLALAPGVYYLLPLLFFVVFDVLMRVKRCLVFDITCDWWRI